MSIPDQVASARAYSDARGWIVAEVFIEPGATGTDDDRPELQRMLEAATSQARPFDVVLVFSLSRFARDMLCLETNIKKLKKYRVQVISVTQEVTDDPNGVMLRRIIATIDEHTSHEIAKCTKASMLRNAQQGFWNGSPAPFGYGTRVAEYRGHRAKKVLEIFEPEAEIVRRMFRMLRGDEEPSKGIKAIVNTLNGEGISFRGKPFHISSVHKVLTRETYAGQAHFNRRDSRTNEVRDRTEWVTIQVPPIVTRDVFDLTQELLSARSPKNTPPRVVSGPTLLTGLAVCPHCGGGMTRGSGKGGRYSYYVCTRKAVQGPTGCAAGRRIRLDVLDELVLDEFIARVLQPDRMRSVLADYLDHSEAAEAERRNRLGHLRAAHTEADGKIRRIVQMVSNELLAPDDPAVRAELDPLKARRSELANRITQLQRESGHGNSSRALTPQKVEEVGRVIEAALRDGDPQFRREDLRLFVDRVEVGETEIRIIGPKPALATAATADQPNAATLVPSFVRQWRARRDSNSQPPDP